MQLEVDSQSVGLEQCLQGWEGQVSFRQRTLNLGAGSVSTDTVPPKKGLSD